MSFPSKCYPFAMWFAVAQLYQSQSHSDFPYFYLLCFSAREAWQRGILGCSLSRMQIPLDDAGPTAERIKRAGEFCTVAGRSKSSRRITMLDDALGRAWMRRFISAEEYSALKK